MKKKENRFKKLSNKKNAFNYSRIFWSALGIICLFSPVITIIIMWQIAPASLENIYIRYTGLDTHLFFNNAKLTGEPLSPEMLQFLRGYYIERVMIETIVRIYNVLTPGLILAAIAALLSISSYILIPKLFPLNRYKWIIGIILFFSVITILSYMLCIPYSLILSLITSVIFVINFPLAAAIENLELHTWKRFVVFFFLVLSAYISHIFAPVIIFLFLASCVFPASSRARRTAINIGRMIVCLFCFPVLTLAFLSFRPISLSPQVKYILKTKDLFDIEMDYAGSQIFVTTGHSGVVYVLSMNLDSLPKTFNVPTPELQDMTLDRDSREFYHVDRSTRNIIVINADTFESKVVGKISHPSTGSTTPALFKSLNRLFVGWENYDLIVVNLNNFQTEAVFPMDYMADFLADEGNGVLYISANDSRTVYALDAKTLEMSYSAPGPSTNMRMVMSAKRRELYIPDPKRSEILVYSTPDLKPLRKIPTQFGVRAMAVDDEHDLLLAASLVTGYIDVIDLNNNKTLQHHYAGKYCRVMTVDSTRRHAFITITKKGLFLLKY